MKKTVAVMMAALLFLLTGCASGGQAAESGAAANSYTQISQEEAKEMILKINGSAVPVTWEDNDSVAALKSLLPLTVSMSMYGGFEQVGPIGRSIVSRDQQTTTAPGDIVLYSGDQLVVFYGSNSWSYTRLGHVELSERELTDLLGIGDVTITISIE